MPRLPRKKKRNRRSRPTPPPIRVRASCTHTNPIWEVHFHSVRDLAMVTKDEEYVSAAFLAYSEDAPRWSFARPERATLTYTAFADYPSGRVRLVAKKDLLMKDLYRNPKAPRGEDPEKCPPSKIVEEAISYWRSQGITVYRGSVEVRS